MASLAQSIQLRDGMSATLNRISVNLDNVTAGFEAMQTAAANHVPVEMYEQIAGEIRGIHTSVQEATAQVNRLGQAFQNAQPAADDFMQTLKQVGTAFIGSKIVSGIVNMSDGLTQTTARLNLMNDGLRSTADLQELIYQSAMRSRGAYSATADAVSKMGLLAGDAFASNEETIAFVEQLNKQFKIAGTSAEGQAAAMLQITQAMGAGVLRGEELNSVFEQVPTVIQTIADYLGVSVGEIRDMAKDGEITAGIVKSALLSAAEETNQKFEQIPMTWSDVWTKASNIGVMALQPLLEAINGMANNIEVIGPLILGIVGAVGILALLANWAKICAAATKLWTGAQTLLNAAWAASPIGVIIAGVVLLIALIFAVVGAINKVCGTHYSALGVITGSLAVAGAFIGNLVVTLINFIMDLMVTLWNAVAAFVNFLANVFEDPVGAIARLFFDLVDTILGLLQSLASAIDTIFGSNFAGAVRGWRDNLDGWVDSTFGKGKEIMTKINAEDTHLKRFTYSGAWDAGYRWGADLQKSISEKFGMTVPEDPATDLLSDIADNTGKTAKSLEITEEDLKYLKDMAEREVINRFTTAEVKLEMVNHNTISGTNDIDGIVDYFGDRLEEMMAVAAEGEHA